MVGATIQPLTGLVGVPAEQLVPYGLKAVGCVELLQAQAESPHPFAVQQAFAMPASAFAAYTSRDTNNAIDSLTAGLTSPAVLMARSSALDESSGQNPTLSVVFRPNDITASKKRFATAVDQVLSVSPQMGVLLTKMVGESSSLLDGREVFGRDNISFIADTHDPTAFRDMHLAMVHGLGSHAVATSDVVFVTVDRATSNVTFFGNQSEERYAQADSSSGDHVQHWKEYRQQIIEVLDMGTGEIVELQPPDETHHAWLERNGCDVLMLNKGELLDQRSFRGRMSEYGSLGFLGINPFGHFSHYQHLVGVMKYLESRFGPVQIEGAWSNISADQLSLYQLIHLPKNDFTPTPLNVTSPEITSAHVMGRIDIQVPLVYVKNKGDDPRHFLPTGLAELDKKLSATGYILLTEIHSHDIIESTPNCRRRLSIRYDNPSSHAVTFTRESMKKYPERGYFFAMQLDGDIEKFVGRFRHFRDSIHVFRDAHLQSNGTEMALKLIKKNLISRLLPF